MCSSDLKFGSAIDFTELNLQSSSPQKYLDYCADLSGVGSTSCDANSLLFYVSWVDNTVDNPFFPTQGRKLSFSADATTPGLDLEYYKIMVKGEQFFPISSSVSTKIKGSIGFGDSYGDEKYPFFKNFRAGGKNSIRGFKEGSVGKKTYDSNSGDWVTYGGKK